MLRPYIAIVFPELSKKGPIISGLFVQDRLSEKRQQCGGRVRWRGAGGQPLG